VKTSPEAVDALLVHVGERHGLAGRVLHLGHVSISVLDTHCAQGREFLAKFLICLARPTEAATVA
jgi:hypothetical protein